MTIINNYEMPENCYMCDLQNYHECDLTGESIEEDYCWNGDSREKHCPLREVEAIPKEEVKQFIENIQKIKDNHNEHGEPINYGTICDILIWGYRLLDKYMEGKDGKID